MILNMKAIPACQAENHRAQQLCLLKAIINQKELGFMSRIAERLNTTCTLISSTQWEDQRRSVNENNTQ
jgi:hypothetical protein